MVIRALVNLIATLTLPALYYPYDAALGVVYDTFGSLNYPAALTLPVAAISSSHKQHQSIDGSLQGNPNRHVHSILHLASRLSALIVKELKPKYTTMKCLLIAAVSVGVTLLVLFLFIGFV